MLTSDERTRFNHLRDHHHRGGTLTDEEAAEVQRLTQKIEDAEAVYLKPATERLRRETESLARHTARMQMQVARLERLAASLQRKLDEWQGKRTDP